MLLFWEQVNLTKYFQRKLWLFLVNKIMQYNYNKQRFCLFVISGEGTPLAAGKHELPFELPLDRNLPCSFEGQFGFIRYTVKVTLERPWKMTVQEKKHFTVIGKLDLNMEPKALVSKTDYKITQCFQTQTKTWLFNKLQNSICQILEKIISAHTHTHTHGDQQTHDIILYIQLIMRAFL